MDAEKIKKKLNGSILKGTKVRIEKAREQKEQRVETAEEPEKPKKEKKSKKRKRGDEIIPGAEIGERSVKRGWTTPGAKVDRNKDKEGKAAVKSKYTAGKECLFKTVLPPNVASKADTTAKSTKDGKKEKGKSKKGKKAVVHEFEKTTKYATFLRTNSNGGNTKGVAEFVEGKGWVDEDGNVVEVAKISRKSAPQKSASKMSTAAKENVSEEESESDDTSSSEEETIHTKVDSNLEILETKDDDSTSSSGSSSEEDLESETSSSEDESDAEALSESSEEEVKTPKKSSRPSSSAGLTIKIPELAITSIPVATEVHPLEALYKRDTKNANPKPTTASFSFFGADGDEEEEEAGDRVQVPMTPFTQKEFEFRGIRSAAPTPDTAHANKRFVWPTDNDEEDQDEEGSSPVRKESSTQNGSSSNAEAPESDFQKWFWENRGETNRAWKKRRKMAAKEQRQRENRKRERRV